VLDASDTAISIEKLELVVSRVERVEPKAR